MDDDGWGGVDWLSCPHCLTPLEVDGDVHSPYLVCADCGMVRLTA